MDNKKHIVFTGGGTLGHVMPNIPLIEHFQANSYSVSYIGSKEGIEKGKILSKQIAYYPVRTGKLRRYFDLQNFLDFFNVVIAIFQCLFILFKTKPDILFSKGGYVALPPVIAAWILRIPVVIHESDMSPGLTTKLSKRFSKKICLSFESTAKYFSKDKTVVTGLPVRKSVFSAKKSIGLKLSGFSGNRPIMLVFGGSLGAEFLNNSIIECLNNKYFTEFDIVNICGKGNINKDINYTNFRQFEYLGDEFLHIIAMSDIVITRGGATSLFELLSMKKKHVIIPLSAKVSRGDQIENAKYFSNLGLSQYIEEENYTISSFVDLVYEVLEKNDLYPNDNSGFINSTNNVVNVIESCLK